ncbi:MAG: tRNA 4-thiouridine(8) synthase ThiI [Oscillospiraceae bacterium]|jgi:thiamine biosynthesis protein ThiI|nr:tRNA 4-thiouridine(8) synthase ThiI [Oscillospiraceae bacterium]
MSDQVLNELILLKQGEMVLKGLNRRSFELRLEQTARRRLAPLGEFDIRSAQSVIYVSPLGSADADMDAAFEACRTVFGIAALVRAARCEKSPDAIFDAAREYLGARLVRAKSFKVETKRSDKRFPMGSIELSQYVGGRLADAFPSCVVDVHTPELTVNVEVREEFAFVHGGAERGAGGLPPGSAGRVVSLLSGGIDSPVATYLAARRGAEIIPIHFLSPPYTSELARKKTLDIVKILSRFCGKLTAELVPFTRVQEAIAERCPEEYGTVLARRFMTRIAARIAAKNGAKALVTGENLGQVASQTLDALACTDDASPIPVLRPVLAFDKREITEWAVKIGTYETSILPYEDCCTVFTPRRPATRPRLEKIREAEAALDVEGLTADALANTERVTFE